jgi:hypothetical protein
LLLQEQWEIELDLPNIGLNLRQHLNDFLLAKCALAQSAKPRHARPSPLSKVVADQDLEGSAALGL